MARGTFVIRDGKLVPKHLAAPLGRKGPRSMLPRPYVIGDVMDSCMHPSTGQRFESKSEFRKVTKALGLTEVGNEVIPEKRDIPVGGTSIGQDLARAWDELGGD